MIGSSAKTASSGPARARIMQARLDCFWIVSRPTTGWLAFIPWSIASQPRNPITNFRCI